MMFQGKIAHSNSNDINKGRDKHIDIIKGFAMLSIIIMHCTSSFISRENGAYIGYSWNVAVFFIIGGFFLNLKKLDLPVSFLVGKLKSLYLPATIIYSINVILHNLFISIGWYPLGVSHHPSLMPFEYYDLKEIVIRIFKVLFAGGSGELSMGAMWFLYTLLYAFGGITFVNWVVSKIFKKAEKRCYWMSFFLLLFAVISCVLTNKYGITINRISTAFTAMFLIWIGMIINKKVQWKYNQWWGVSIAIITFIHCVIMRKGEMALATNKYQDIVMLLAGSLSLIYIWGFIGKRLESNVVGEFFALMGRESLYLMAFHILGFFICNDVMEYFQVFSKSDLKGLYTYNLESSGWLLLVYVLFGVGFSFGVRYGFRFMKTIISKRIIK